MHPTCALGSPQKKHPASKRTSYGLWLIASTKFLMPFSLLVALGTHLGWPRPAAVSQPRVLTAMESIGQPFEPTMPAPIPSYATSGAFATVAGLLPASLLVLWSIGCVFVVLMWYLRWRRLSAMRRAALPTKSGRELEVLRRIERTARFSQHIDPILSKSALESGN